MLTTSHTQRPCIFPAGSPVPTISTLQLRGVSYHVNEQLFLVSGEDIVAESPPQIHGHHDIEHDHPQLSVPYDVVQHMGFGSALQDVTAHAHAHPVLVQGIPQLSVPFVVVSHAGTGALHEFTIGIIHPHAEMLAPTFPAFNLN